MTFDEWYKENERRFHTGQMNEKEIACAAWYESTEKDKDIAELRQRVELLKLLCDEWERRVGMAQFDDASFYEPQIEQLRESLDSQAKSWRRLWELMKKEFNQGKGNSKKVDKRLRGW